MSLYVLKMFVVSLAFTLVLELVVFICVQRSVTRKTAWLVVLVNLLTNPAAVWCVWVAGMLMAANTVWIVEILVEAVVFCVEAGLYVKFAQKENWNMKRPVLTACAANMVSWGAGVVWSLNL